MWIMELILELYTKTNKIKEKCSNLSLPFPPRHEKLHATN